MDQILIIGGIALLYGGGELLVRYAGAMGRTLGMSPLLVGLTIVSFGTSAPELASSLIAALRGSTDIALANVVGSNIANVGMVVGLVVLLKPVTSNRKLSRVDVPTMLALNVLFVLLCLGDMLSRVDGVILLFALCAYLVFAFRTNADETHAGASEGPSKSSVPLWKGTTGVLFGLVCLAVGADWLVDGAVHVARDFGISERVIGLTLVALGTSLPELATSLVAAYHEEHDLLLGNVVGSNVFNMLAVAGITSLVNPIPVHWNLIMWDLTWMFGLSAMLLVMVNLTPRLTRPHGIILSTLYATFIMNL